MKIDVAIPTFGGENCITETLNRLQESVTQSDHTFHRLILDYKPKRDRTDEIVRDWAQAHNVDLQIHVSDRNLPKSREFLCSKVTTPWFLFLDDDVRMREDTLSKLTDCIATQTGAVQVRKAVHEHDRNASWSKWRNVRGTTFATLVRRECVADLNIPSEITQLEDEYIRQHIEDAHDKLWLFNHQAIIDHDNQGRHAINYTEGRLAAKYDLLPYDYIYGNVPYNIINRGHPWKHTKRALGYTVGKLHG